MKDFHFAGMLLPLLFSIFFSLPLTLPAQSTGSGAVKGGIVDAKTRLPIEAASVTIKNAEAYVVQNSATSKDGSFLIRSLAPGQYELWVSFVGYATLKQVFAITEKGQAVDLGFILLDQGLKLNEVVITADKAPVTIKKDTIEFNAASFKTQANDNVEELLKKLPGVDIDKNGKITVHGREVRKVLVDGNEFFGGDPKAPTRNLPADAIKKIQLIDEKTEQTKNTGIDNGQRDKVINLTIREDKKKGWFGNAAVAGGSSDSYLGQLNMNRFNKDQQLSFLLMANNVNQSGFSLDDLNNFSAGNVSNTFGSGDGSTTINTYRNGSADVNGVFSGVGNGGLINTHSGGINFSNTAGQRKQLRFNGSYVAILSSNTITKLSDIRDPLANEMIYTSQSAFGQNSSHIHRANLNINYKPDTLTTIRFNNALSLAVRKNLTDQNYSSVNQASAPVNSGRQYFDQKTTSPSFGGQLAINRLISRNRGSVNFSANGNYNGSATNYINQATTQFFINGTQALTAFNQQADQKTARDFVNGTVSYTGVLNKAKKLGLFAQHNFQYTNDQADQVTLEYNPSTGWYETLVPSLSNNYTNKNWRNTTTVGFNGSVNKINYELNSAIAYLGLSGHVAGTTAYVKRSAVAFLPGINLYYRQPNGINFSAGIGSGVNMPSVSDMQPVFNNTNPLYIRLGNPDLGMSRSANAYLNYNVFNMRTNQSIQIRSTFIKTWNGFSTARTVDPDSRIQTVKPVNVNGNYSFNIGVNSGKQTKLKGLKLRLDAEVSINRNISFINEEENKSDRLSTTFRAGANYSKDFLTLNIDQAFNYNKVNNSLQSFASQEYYRFNTEFGFNIEPIRSFRIFCDLSLTMYAGANSNSLSNGIVLMNGGMEKFFMKSRQVSIMLTGFDLLNQNPNLQRSVSATGRIEDIRTNSLNRYVYLKLNYKLQRSDNNQR